MKATGCFLRTAGGAVIALVLVGVSPAQTTSAGTQNTAGPFGFNCGASKQAITGQVGSLKEEGVNQYSTGAAPTPFPNVGYYLLTISPTQGLLKVSAETNDIETDTTGADLINQFHAIEAELTKQYGKPARQEDFLKPGSVWAGQDEWTLSYMKKERTLASHWVFTPPNHCVTSINLTAEVANQTTGAVLIEFKFTGYVPPAEDLSKKKNATMDTSK